LRRKRTLDVTAWEQTFRQAEKGGLQPIRAYN